MDTRRKGTPGNGCAFRYLKRGIKVFQKNRVKLLSVALLIALTAVLFAGCAKAEDKKAAQAPQKTEMVLASTTSTQDSGLFDVLIPAFEKANPDIKVQVVAVGTGEAIQKGRDGDADGLLVHAKADEEAFVKEGYADSRADVMYNQFLIVGPKDDPAKIAGSKTAAEAFKKIADAKAKFISRADDSGTNKKELKIWEAAGITPKGSWYEESGQGMGDTLKMTDEMGAYTLADQATYLTMSNEKAIESIAVFEGADDLLNQYGVLVVKGAKQEAAAQKFYDWIISPEGQEVIKNYGVDTFGTSLFTPNAVK